MEAGGVGDGKPVVPEAAIGDRPATAGIAAAPRPARGRSGSEPDKFRVNGPGFGRQMDGLAAACGAAVTRGRPGVLASLRTCVILPVCIGMLPVMGCSRAPAPVPRAVPVAEAAAPSPSTPAGPPWFVDVTAAAGIDFVHHSGDSPEKPFPSANGSGLAAFDYDRDGRPDLYFASGTTFPVEPDRLPVRSRLVRNLGRWRFADATAASGLACGGYAHGIAVGDYDADGFADVFVSCYGPDRMFLNRGDGTFAAVTVGVEDDRWGASAAFLDYDDDGLLDLYVCNYAKWSPETNPWCGDQERGIRVFCGPLSAEPEGDALFRNEGDGSFRDVTIATGCDVRPGRGMGVLAAHLDDDTRIDLYVANDLNANVVLLNDGDGRFRDASELSGAAYDHAGRVKSSMGIDAADTRGSGRLDILVTDFESEANLFFVNAGDGMFRDASDASGVGPPSVPFVSWGVVFADLDLDGWNDAVITNGHVGDDRHTVATDGLRQPALVLHNVRGTFRPVPAADLGDYFASVHQGRGLTSADFDGDGDPDLAFNHRDEPATLLRNDRGQPQAAGRSIVLHLVGTTGNRDAVGAVVRLRTAGRTQVEQIKGGGSYQSARDGTLTFALLPGEEAAAFEIRWPGGRETTIQSVGPGRHLVVESAAGGTPRVVSGVVP